MKIQFLGATQGVTGSRYLVSAGRTKILVDCGLFQGFKNFRLKNWAPFPVDPKTIDAVVLTHAHLDHSGYIPLLVKSGFRGPILCSPATLELCEILLRDSGYLQEEEARFANKKGFSKHKPALPLYTQDDAVFAMTKFKSINWHHTEVFGDFQISLSLAGHILGASSVHLSSGGRSILFSGDLGRTNDALLPDPESPPPADAMVIESTYGDRVHPNEDPKEELAKIINSTLHNRGTVLIPSFAVGRAQLILNYCFELRQQHKIPNVSIYLNSPMASKVNEVFCKYAGTHKLDAKMAGGICDMARIISTPEESIDLNKDMGPKIIIAASGMATGGRVLHHLKTLLPDPKNTVVFVGFQAGGTRGEAMVNGVEKIKIHGAYWPIRARVVSMSSLSAHADAPGLINWARRMSPAPKSVFITHGEPRAAEALRIRFKEELNIESEVPELMASFDI